MKISAITLGCKLNQAETNEIVDKLQKMGCVVVPFNEPADVAIIRACAVTQNASQTARELIRRAKRRGSYVIVSGCLENRDLPEIDFIAKDNEEVAQQIVILNSKRTTGPLTSESDALLKSGDPSAAELTLSEENVLPQNDKLNIKNRTRALIKIQSGCNFNCAYCVIPQYRGKSQSVRAKSIIGKIKSAKSNGYKEITLTGVNICQYRDGKTDLADLLKKIISETKIERIRLGSLDPRLVTNKLINHFANNRLMPHWHLSLQSGSDSVLKKMNRGYTVAKYYKIVQKLRQLNSLFSLTTDIIAGFPSETEKDFGETLAFVKKVGFTKVHVFPYSPRPNTKAAKMPNAVHDKIKTERVARLISAASAAGDKFTRKFIGKIRPVLFESKKDGYWYGLAPEYFPIKHGSAQNLKNKIINLKIIAKNLNTSR